MNLHDILDILHDEPLAETAALKCTCYNGKKTWCEKCDARLSAIKAYRKAIFDKIDEIPS